MNYETLKAAIVDVIKQNGNEEITGDLLQQTLVAMVNSLGAGYQFMGVATPSTNPGTPDQKVFYLASQAGTYISFDNVTVGSEICALRYNGTWVKESICLFSAITSNFYTKFETDTKLAGKADKDFDAADGNLAQFNANGNPIDSGEKISDYVKKINNPLGVGAGLQSVYQKNPYYPNTSSGRSAVALGANNTASAKRAIVAGGGNNTASGEDAFVSGYHNEASGDTATATGHYTTASGNYSHTQGHATKATNESASAEGNNTEASGKYSHAQGLKTKATESTAHAQGQETIADASAAHAEGYKTHSSGVAAHAQGEGTQTTNRAEHAQGRYNVSRRGKTRSSIGIGTSNNARMNAFEVTEDGKIWILGAGGYTGVASQDLANVTDLATLLANFAAGPLIITVTNHTSSDTHYSSAYTPNGDMTFDDILAAYHAGRQIMVKDAYNRQFVVVSEGNYVDSTRKALIFPDSVQQWCALVAEA